ncbi:helicase [Gordonia phage Phendrix]|uniref:Helicase n=1 Tax=Gordonia phage Phendrix TaxID=2593335 RepID=A0A514U1D7_9CAUD|nr:helicase [Gordonia phage Phendrix]QDK02729.1 helicase [Gordonia phage Phendrix]
MTAPTVIDDILQLPRVKQYSDDLVPSTYKWTHMLCQAICLGDKPSYAPSDIVGVRDIAEDWARLSKKYKGEVRETDYLRLARTAPTDTVMPSDDETVPMPVAVNPSLKLEWYELAAMVMSGAASLGSLAAALWPVYYAQTITDDIKYQGYTIQRGGEDGNLDREWIENLCAMMHVAEKKYTANDVQEITTSVFRKWREFDDVWGEDIPFRSSPKPIPIDGFPTVLSNYIKDFARANEVAVDAVTTVALSTLACATLNTVWVYDEFHEHSEPFVLNFAVLANSGERKSTIFNKVLHKSMQDYTEFAQQQNTVAARHRAKRLREIDRELATLTKGGGSRGPSTGPSATATGTGTGSGMWKSMKTIDDYEEEKAFLETSSFKQWPTTLDNTNNPTIVQHLETSWTGMTAITSPDTSIFKAVGRTALIDDRQTLLLAMSGDPIKVARKTTTGANVDKPALNTCVMTQVKSFNRYISENQDAQDDGFIPRFNVVYTEPQAAKRTFTEVPIDHRIETAWLEVVKTINMVARDYIETEIRHQEMDRTSTTVIDWKEDQKIEPRMLKAKKSDVNAASDYVKWCRKRMKEVDTGRRYDAIAAWISKSPARVLQIAAALTLVDDAHATVIDSKYLKVGMQVVDSLTEHYLFAVHTTSDDDLRSVYHKILDVMNEKANLDEDGEPMPVKQRDLKRHFNKRQTDHFEHYLKALEDLNKIRRDKARPTGRGAPIVRVKLRPKVA